MSLLLQDLRYGLRMLARRPGFTLVAVITLALGIGANTAIFSVVNAVQLKPLPFPEPDNLVVLSETSKEVPEMAVAFPDYLDWRGRQTTFEFMAARMPAGGIITGDGDPERVIGQWVTASFFPTLGVKPEAGRFFTDAEDQPGAERVMVISYGLWQRHFGGDPEVIGKPVLYNSESWTLIGVMPRGFDFYGTANLNNDFFIPISRIAGEPYMRDRNSHGVMVVARLRHGMADAAPAEMRTIAAQLAQDYPASNTGNSVRVRGLLEDYVGDVQPALMAMLAAVALVLLIACVNVANLLLGRALSRQKEVALRMALGAGRRRIFGQLLTESLLLAVLGGAFGFLLALWGVDLLVRLQPDSLPRLDQVSVDPRVLGFTLLTTLLTGVLFGLMPARQTAKVDLNESLKAGGRSALGSAGGRRLRGALVVGEIALALVVFIGAGLLFESFRRLMQVDSGFEAHHVLTLRLRLADVKYPEASQTTGFLKEVMARTKALPGVEEVSVSTGFPLGRGTENDYWVEGQPEPRLPGDWAPALTQSISEAYLRALGIRLLAGRQFTEFDSAQSAPVVIVDDDFVRRNFPDQPPEYALGKRLRFGGDNELWRQIVGVVRHVRHNGPEEAGRPGIYRPWTQIEPRWLANLTRAMDLIVKTSTAPEALIEPIRQEVRAIDKDQPLGNVRTLDSRLAEALAPRRFSLMLFAVFAGVALILAAVGIYGVMSYAVHLRTPEIGLRVALGAQSQDILKQVLAEAAKLAFAGISAGLLAAALLTRLMAGLLFEVRATDFSTFASTAAILAGIALLASYLPARRATRVDPLIALRHE